MAIKYLGHVKMRIMRGRDSDYEQWESCFPFVVNPRGHLIHRVREAGSILRDGIRHHDYAHYWCGNQTCIREDRGVFYAVPPADRLLCVRCEQLAVAAGEKSASEIAGRHVHIGIMKPVRICCRETKN